MNLASYVQKCLVEIKEPDEIKDPNQADTLELIPKSRVTAKWFDFKGQKSELFYVVGPIDDLLLSQLYPIASESSLGQDEIKRREDFRKDA